MGSQEGSRAAGQRGSPADAASISHHRWPILTEEPVAGSIPRYEIPNWRERFAVVAGITGRGGEPGRGFDLGLWTKEPVGEVMSRWLSFRREMHEFSAIALGNQVHGVEVMTLNSAQGWVYLDGIDGWVTSTPGILLSVTVADCIPVYLVVPGRAVALLHAGWRGTAGGILARGIERLTSLTSTPSSNMVMHCGMGICGSCYEVGSEVMAGCGAPAKGAGPWHLDLRECLADQGASAGIRVLTTSSWCSAHDGSRFYSHRASGGRDGRMVAYLGMLSGNDPAVAVPEV
jgi:copper oxidase (laccase) domain-containing protein